MNCQLDCDVDNLDNDDRRRRKQSLRAQSKASMSASCNHFTIYWFTKITRTTLHSDFRFPVTVLWSHKQSWLCQNLSSLALNVPVVLAETT